MSLHSRSRLNSAGVRLGIHCRIAICLLTLLSWTAGFGTSLCSGADDWEVKPIYIPESSIQQLAQGDFEIVPLKELIEELRREKIRRETAEFNIPKLDQAIYVARVENAGLVSEQSRWLLSGETTGSSLSLGRISVAIAEAQGVSMRGREQLIGNHRVSPDGELQMDFSGQEIERWFGFSTRPESNGLVDAYQFTLPVATMGLMLINAPDDMQLRSTDIVVSPIDSPADFLPADWPNLSTFSPSASLGRKWWILYLSGLPQFNLEVAKSETNRDALLEHIITDAKFDYLISDTFAELTAQFVIGSDTQLAPIRIIGETDLRVTGIRIGAESVAWQTVPGPEGRNVFSLPGLSSEGLKGKTLTVEATCLRPDALDWQLPSVEIAGSLTIKGITNVLSAGRVVVEKLVGREAEVVSVAVDERSAQVPLAWQATWCNSPPQLTAGLASTQSRWVARSLTKIGIQADWISAECRVRVEADEVNSNELVLRVGRGWFVDSAVVLGDSAEFFNTRTIESGSEQEPNTEIRVSWDQGIQSKRIELNVSAHRPIRMQGDRVQLLSRSVLTVPNADQIDSYVIEPTAMFKMQLSDLLLASQLEIDEVPGWQQELLSGHDDRWILQGGRRTTPQVALAESQGRYDSRLVTAILENPDQSANAVRDAIDVRYFLRIDPLDRVIDSVSISVPSDAPIDAMQWSIVGVEPGSQESVTFEQVGEGAEFRILRLDLARSRSTPFTLHCSLPAIRRPDNKLAVFVIGCPDAINADSTLILSHAYSDLDIDVGVEVLPVAACCGDGVLSDIFSVTMDLDLEQVIGARLNGKSSAAFKIVLDDDNVTIDHGWIWNEVVESWLDDAEIRTHRIRLEVQAASDGLVDLQLPDGWWMERAWVNGQPTRTVDRGVQGNVQIRLPPLRKSQLELRCRSKSTQKGWLAQERVEYPSVNLRVLKSAGRLYIPPGQLVVKRLWASRNDTAMRRLQPAAWWQWLSPSSESQTVDLQYPGWTTVNFSGEARQASAFDITSQTSLQPSGKSQAEADSPASPASLHPPASLAPLASLDPLASAKVWIANRNAVAVVALGCLMALSVSLCVVLRDSVRAYWIGIASLACCVVLVPAWLLLASQLALLSVILAALLRLTRVVVSSRNSETDESESSWITSWSNFKRNIVTGCMILVCQSASGQLADESATNREKSRPEIFGVLIPQDGSHAYVPRRLRDLLRNPMDSTRAFTTGIYEATYTLQISSSASTQSMPHSLVAEFRVSASAAGAQLELPIARQQLRLVQHEVNGQADTTFVSQNENAVVFSADMAGEHSLKLYFTPMLVGYSNGQFGLRAQIPEVPASKVRVIHDQQTAVRVIGSGQVNETVSGELQSLGPVDDLQIQWETSELNASMTLECGSHLWMNSTASRVTAAAQVMVRNAKQLGSEFKLLIDDDWVPVGWQWGDVNVVSSELEPLGNRRVYVVRRNEASSGESGQTETGELRIALLLSPRVAERDQLPVPFVGLQDYELATRRTFTWSSGQNSQWMALGTNYWPRDASSSSAPAPANPSASSLRASSENDIAAISPLNGDSWGALELSKSWTRYRVPLGSPLSGLIRRGDSEIASLPSESNVISFSGARAELDYRLEWEEPSEQTSTKRFELPSLSRVSSVLVNDMPVEYEVVQKGARTLLLVGRQADQGEYRSLDIRLSIPVALSRNFSLKRVVAIDDGVASSMVSIYRRPGVDCELLALNDEFVIGKLAGREEDIQLDDLKMIVGSLEVGDRFRYTSELPVDLRVTSQANRDNVASVLYVDRDDLGWQGTLVARWPKTVTGRKFVFLEIPTAIQDSIQLDNVVGRFLATGDPKRLALCCVLEESSNDAPREIVLRFGLNSGASVQSVAIPDVKVLGDQSKSPILALPNEIDGQEVDWLTSGRYVQDDWHDFLRPFEDKLRDYRLLNSGELQASWQAVDRLSKSAELLRTRVHLAEIGKHYALGEVDFWLRPRGQLSLTINRPSKVSVVGILIGNQVAQWDEVDGGKLRVLCQPNYLPVNLRLLLRWQLDANAPEVDLPEIELASKNVGDTVVEIAPVGWNVNGAISEQSNLDAATLWQSLLDETMPTLQGLATPEAESWLQAWHPTRVAIDAEIQVPFGTQNGKAELDLENENTGTALDYWVEFCDSLGVMPSVADLPSATEDSNEGFGPRSPPSRFFRIDYGTLKLEASNVQKRSYAGVGFAFGIAIVCLAMLRMATRLRASYFELLSRHPWTYWLQLALFTWLVLPISWPSYVLLLTAAGMGLSQLFEFRRVTQYR